MNDVAPLPPEDAPRGRWVGRGLVLLAIAAIAWVGWREYDHRAAVREARAAGWMSRMNADGRTCGVFGQRTAHPLVRAALSADP